MIGKAEWFRIRKWGGWGLQPATKEGWIYLFSFMIPFIVFQALPYWSDQVRAVVTAAWMSVLLIDVLHIMSQLKKDERELVEEAMAERNASWTMIVVLTGSLLYQIITSALNKQFQIDPTIMMALAGGVIAKSLTYWKMERK